ncbi:hypothetical protein FIV42_28385 [Persicimonas caeni]|uniref:Big-1 domain-containing protein n=1 Tax=Persicimonas caeni TaxID=2292766 RepID=A0A4Y6Q1P4_PERCE|nr:Ig-like domain-containing protein [Persicimonas caeni]QDG54521.1 hypothetical protein FIV42_28385 [Persicimonas caeni]QED35742.1 hypothetical protein FRD00_28380 [Persicimonas caeni]
MARRILAALMVSLLALGAVSCTDDPAQANNVNDNNRIDDPIEPPDTGELLHVGPDCNEGQTNCVVDLTTLNEREIQAKLVDEDGQPVENALISFEGTFDGTEISIGASSAYTDSNGIAKTTLSAGNVVGTGELVATTSQDAIEPIKWVVGVSTKGSASYRVSFEHNGSAQIKPITVRLFQPDVTCDELAANPNQTAVVEKQGLVDAAGNMPTVVFPDRPNGDSYTVAAWAKSLDNNEVEVAYGCADNNPEITNGQPVDVLVTLVDHIPTITGEYAVTHQFDLTGALPDNVRTVVELIGRLATDPGSFVVGCPDSGTADCPAGSPGIVQLLVDFLPDGDLKDSIESFLGSSIGNGLVRDAINSIADNWIQNDAPDWVRNAVNITGDIYRTLREFKVEGVIRINDAPQVSIDPNTGEVVGILPAGAGEQTWNDFIFYWSRGCENATDQDACAQRRFGARQLDMTDNDAPVEGTFDGAVFGADKLQINQHSLSLNYGALLIAIIEKVVLPEIFGSQCGSADNQPCDSLELALQEMISCASVADQVADPGESTYQIVENLCDSLLAQASDQLRDYAANNLVADGSEVFLLGTPDGEHCTISQPEVYPAEWEGKPLPYIQHFGQEEPAEMQCKWAVRIKFSDSYTAEVDGNFWGERSSF